MEFKQKTKPLQNPQVIFSHQPEDQEPKPLRKEKVPKFVLSRRSKLPKLLFKQNFEDNKFKF